MRPSFSLGPALLAAFVAFAAPHVARANPRPLPFTYQHEQLSKGDSELEQFVDYTPTRAQAIPSGDLAWYGLSQFTTEFETGLTDRLELGLYVTLAPGAPADFTNVAVPTDGNGLKQRLRWSLAAPGEWPLDVSLYGELAENEREFEIEAKVLLQRRIGFARIVANLSGEREMYYDGGVDWVLNPSAGVTFDPSPVVQPGLEAWMRGEWEAEPENGEATRSGPRPFGLGPHVYLGPTILLQFSKLWWSNGFYVRVTDRSHTLQPGEGFGNVWFRTVIGLGL